jgi:hypothetical protein
MYIGVRFSKSDQGGIFVPPPNIKYSPKSECFFDFEKKKFTQIYPSIENALRVWTQEVLK